MGLARDACSRPDILMHLGSLNPHRFNRHLHQLNRFGLYRQAITLAQHRRRLIDPARRYRTNRQQTWWIAFTDQ
jgi:hypothetical protein